MKDLGAVILAGGKSSRMGKDKALLRLDNETFLQRVQKQLTAFDEVLLSVSRETQYPQSGMAQIVDQYAEIGPMGGLYSALTACSSARLLAVTCDMPFFTDDLAEYMYGYVADGYDAFVVVTREDRLQPLCAIYSKSAAPILKKQIDKKNYRIIDALAFLRVKRIPLAHSVYADDTVQNINTPEEYADLRRRRQGPPIIAVCGLKNTGKTTLLIGIIPCLRRAGLKVAVVK
ncbi:MAG: molybdopterin-guanine dinucleotide biosynthesis protein MobB, partial [Gracilibacteraceae bacterium]|nr:molybdopterin-guanine dinucleotide biosynthesis protein MobB [Gracilibacteraceae bacterium]